MKQDQHPRQGFEEKLLTELKGVISAGSRKDSPPTEAPRMARRQAARRTAWRRRVAVSTGIAAALAITLAVVLPAVGGESARNQAYAVTEDDGMVTVEIRSIEDPEGLERKLHDVGVPAAVHYLPAGKLCSGGETSNPHRRSHATRMNVTRHTSPSARTRMGPSPSRSTGRGSPMGKPW